jgi:transcriptional regulator with XRE-family HTH domain
MNHKEIKKIFLKNNANENMSFAIAKDIKTLRISKKLTQKQLAEKIGTKQSSIARLENAGYAPNLNFLVKISDALGVKLVPPKFIYPGCSNNEGCRIIFLTQEAQNNFNITYNTKNTDNKFATKLN